LKLWIVLALCAAAYSGSAASFSPEVFASIAWAHVFRFDDQTFGDRPNAGAGFGLHHRSGLGAELEISRTFGLMARTTPCAISGVSCVGTGCDGALALRFGAGLRMPITRAVALRSEVRFYDGSARSRANLSIIRTSIGLGYRW
jgi:opacity protein-like surface antigen